VPVNPPVLDVAVNVVTAEPPVALAVNGTVAVVPLTVAVPIVGACGTDAGVTALLAADAVDTPLALVAVTVYVREVPAPVVSETVIGLDDPVPVLPEEDVTVYPVMVDPPVAPPVNVTEVLAEPVKD
jgi:hypothetical protein